MAYGKELILDLYECDATTFNRTSIEEWLVQLCDLINMQREDLYFWDYEGYPEEQARAPEHLAGTSAVQFITTSDIVIHTLDKIGECYINIFSCKNYNCHAAKEFTKAWFKARVAHMKVIIRGELSQVETDIPDDNCVSCASGGKCNGARYIRQPCPNFRKD